jgi:hypothetical protein
MNQSRSWKGKRLKGKISYREDIGSDTRYQKELTAEQEEEEIVEREHDEI